MSILDDNDLIVQFRAAWKESDPGTDNSHEEGGFVLRNSDGSLSVERWPRGAQNEILVPPHSSGLRNGKSIVATFHTHPNPGAEFQQEPSLSDIRAVRDDPDLANVDYEGEYVISTETIYRIHRDGRVESIGNKQDVLRLN
jgi:Domain of unknown function (DUF4329)